METPSDWVSAEGLRSAIGIPGADAAYLDQIIEEAVDWVSRDLDLPLVNVELALTVRALDGSNPLILSEVYHPLPEGGLVSLGWWGVDPPAGAAMALAGDGRLVAVSGSKDGGDWLVYPPPGGWPADARWIEVVVRRGLFVDQHPVLRSAVRSMARGIYLGQSDDALEKLTDRLLAVYAPRSGFLPVQAQGRG